jgi:predicted O-methyltransferase YrrM
MMTTLQSLEFVREISKSVKTFHHHYHILYDLGREFIGRITYLEIGTYYGASACLMLQRPETNVITVDIGGTPEENILNNLRKFNKHESNVFTFIRGNSHDQYTVRKIAKKVKDSGVDILFIDGNHLYLDVIDDFVKYSPFVNRGGYVVFDDYNDEGDPEVALAVNKIVETLEHFIIVGTIPNRLGAFPQEMKEGNCFILKKV